MKYQWVTNYTTGDITTTCNPLKMCKVHLVVRDQIGRKMAGGVGAGGGLVRNGIATERPPVGHLDTQPVD